MTMFAAMKCGVAFVHHSDKDWIPPVSQDKRHCCRGDSAAKMKSHHVSKTHANPLTHTSEIKEQRTIFEDGL